jgi:hypothetical protein
MANRSKKTSRRLRRKYLKKMRIECKNESIVRNDKNEKNEKKVKVKYLKKEFEKDMTSIISKMFHINI